MRAPIPSKLERAAANAPAPSAEPGRLERAAIGARVHEPFTIPRLGVAAIMTLLTHDRIAAIEMDVAEFERALNLTPGMAAEIVIETERAARYCAEAVLDPDDLKPLGPVDVWRTKIDPDILGHCYRFYADVRAKHDPVGVGCTQEELDEIAAVIRKKEMPTEIRLQLLRSYGVRLLSSWLATMGEQLLDLATPKSSDGPSSSASSIPSPPPPTLIPGAGIAGT